MAIILATSSINAEEVKEEYTTLNSDKYVLDIHDSVSGGIITIFNLLQNNKNNNVQILTETEIKYQDNPETQAKLAKFKEILNAKLQSDQLSQTFYYKTASAELSDKHINYLNNIVLSLNDYENLQYEIKGYSDTRGNAEYNEQLSLARINSVTILLNKLNVPNTNISIDNKGETQSEENAGYEDLFFDRKVELVITKK